MYRLILAALIAFFAIMVMPSAAAAKPTEIHKVHKVKKHTHKRKAIVVKAQHNPFLRCEGCTTAPVTVSSASSEQSAGEFFREDRARTAAQKIIASPTELSRDQKRQQVARKCSWFSCSENNQVVAQAKAWEGKSAKNNRKELKDLFAGVFGYPIDPARIPWCAAFANAILRRENMPTTHSLMARSFLNWGVVTHDPKEGDVVVLARGGGKTLGHVGFFMGYEYVEGIKYVKVLGGNTDHAVQVGYYPVSRVVGYRTFA
jgi:uncharacterized protein (TIGR02594 family)